ncbi:uncharacterized protein H6S33_001682 [Morchella sextelata]|uniref:uncharacterized protein n=1 Tax=Morchella sextelata TaxID=1174677 RepID=UPI001D05A2CE|nr:uncharacterized protein H6S33_001682 [Morchella sextelata]KAH0608548.1 hypothetical protein H6S33_001682 [Morchella sextelata]
MKQTGVNFIYHHICIYLPYILSILLVLFAIFVARGTGKNNQLPRGSSTFVRRAIPCSRRTLIRSIFRHIIEFNLAVETVIESGSRNISQEHYLNLAVEQLEARNRAVIPASWTTLLAIGQT